MAKRNVRIGSHTFNSKKQAKEYIRSIFSRYDEGETITGGDDNFLRDLILLHPEADQKIGSGVRSFVTRSEPIWKKTRHFVLIRSDGSSTDFSFLSCLGGANKEKDVVSAFRQAISDQIISFKTKSFSGDVLPVCPYLKISIQFHEAHVDHAAPKTFRRLVSDWLALEKLTLGEVIVSSPSDNQWVSELVNSEQRDSWSRFHLEQASLRIVSKTANLSHAKLTPKTL